MNTLIPCLEQDGKRYRRHDGQRLFSVSTVIAGLVGNEYDSVSRDLLHQAQLEGTLGHRAVCNLAAIRAGLLIDSAWPERPPELSQDRYDHICRHATTAARAFFQTFEVDPLLIEHAAESKRYGFAGQPDLKCWARIPWRTRIVRSKTIVDFKFVREVRRASELQVIAYSHLDGYADARAKMIVNINKETGDYKVIFIEEKPQDWPSFLGQLAAMKWREANGYPIHL